MNPKEINELAMYMPIANDGLDVKALSPGYAYKQNRLIIRSKIDNPVNRYAKNYTVGKKKYSLCFITHDNNVERVEKWLDTQADKLKESDVETSFKMLGVKYEQ